VAILAVYYPGSLELTRDQGDRLSGKVVVDISNPLNQTFDGLATAPGTSAAEEVAHRWSRKPFWRVGIRLCKMLQEHL